jgi:hypothetical protein
MNKLIKTLFWLAVPLLAIGWYLSNEISQSADDARAIRAEIELINDCDVPASYFAVQKLANGRRYSIAKGRITIDATMGEKLQLVLSASVKDVEYEGVIFKAKEFQRITADCSFGERQRGVTEGLKGTFSN